MDNLERLAWFLFHYAVEGTAVNACLHLLAFIDHRFEHFQVLAGLSVRSDPLQASFALFRG